MLLTAPTLGLCVSPAGSACVVVWQAGEDQLVQVGLAGEREDGAAVGRAAGAGGRVRRQAPRAGPNSCNRARSGVAITHLFLSLASSQLSAGLYCCFRLQLHLGSAALAAMKPALALTPLPADDRARVLLEFQVIPARQITHFGCLFGATIKVGLARLQSKSRGHRQSVQVLLQRRALQQAVLSVCPSSWLNAQHTQALAALALQQMVRLFQGAAAAHLVALVRHSGDPAVGVVTSSWGDAICRHSMGALRHASSQMGWRWNAEHLRSRIPSKCWQLITCPEVPVPRVGEGGCGVGRHRLAGQRQPLEHRQPITRGRAACRRHVSQAQARGGCASAAEALEHSAQVWAVQTPSPSQQMPRTWLQLVGQPVPVVVDLVDAALLGIGHPGGVELVLLRLAGQDGQGGGCGSQGPGPPSSAAPGPASGPRGAGPLRAPPHKHAGGCVPL